MAPERPNQFKILLSDEELKMLRELAERDGLTASDYVRLFVRKESAQLKAEKIGFGPGPKRAREPKPRLKK
jgi:hypothetical protein